MDINDSVTTFLQSIDWSLLWPIIGGLIAFIIVLGLKGFADKLLCYWAIKRDKDLRVGAVYRFSTSTGSKIGILTRWDFGYTRFRFKDHYERIPNKELANGRLQIVKIDPCEELTEEKVETILNQ